MLLLSLPQRVWQSNAGCGPAVFMQQGCAEAFAASVDAAVLPSPMYQPQDSALRGWSTAPLAVVVIFFGLAACKALASKPNSRRAA